MKLTRGRARALAALVAAGMLWFGVGVFDDDDASAQPRGTPPRTGGAARPPPPKPRAPAKQDAGAPGGPDGGTNASASAGANAGAGTNASAGANGGTSTGGDAGVVESKGADGGAQTIRFGELEIEGRLKSPQLVYFLRRVRAEFGAGDLGHRSFMRELSETRKDPAF